MDLERVEWRRMIWLALFLSLMALVPSSAFAEKSCQRQCGKMVVPYPFGIEKGCYLSKFFEVHCKRGTKYGELVAYLPSINKKLLEINLPRQDVATTYGSLRVEAEITSIGCSDDRYEGFPGRSKAWVNGDGKETGSLLDLTETPYTIGRSNSLVAIGCNNQALLTNLAPRVVGCTSSCIQTRNIRDKGPCHGYQCCRVDTPERVGHVIGISVEGINGNTSAGGCKKAFLTDRFNIGPSPHFDMEWFLSTNYTPTVQLRWSVHTANVSSFGCPKKTRCKCHNLKDSELGYSACSCSSGYSGNPYIMGGCKDIDECQMLHDGRRKFCGGGTCVNTPGDFYCVYKKNKALPIIIGVFTGLGVLLFVGLIFWVYILLKRQRKIRQKQRFFKRNGGLLLQQQLHSNAGSVQRTTIFSSTDLDHATEGFSTNRVLGQGGQGTVYKGMLLDGRIVAVKKSKAVDENNLEQFINELVILSQINHRNIVKVLGCCLETQVPIIVYEYVPNGDLSKLLRNSTSDTSWELRLCIATDIVGALSYMHSEASIKIYHRDIKSSNIMLDENNRAKISDFGISRSVTLANTHLTTGRVGTVGYMDPEYYQTGQYTEKSDVYSFGVVLIELITGEKTVTQQDRCLARDFSVAVKESRLADVIDVKIKDNHNPEQVNAAALLARRCVRRKGSKRPTMREVAVELERIHSSESVAPQQLEESDDEDEVLQFDADSSESSSSSQFQTPPLTFCIDVEPFLVQTEITEIR